VWRIEEEVRDVFHVSVSNGCVTRFPRYERPQAGSPSPCPKPEEPTLGRVHISEGFDDEGEVEEENIEFLGSERRLCGSL
jgi:hypothetical protein